MHVGEDKGSDGNENYLPRSPHILLSVWHTESKMVMEVPIAAAVECGARTAPARHPLGTR